MSAARFVLLFRDSKEKHELGGKETFRKKNVYRKIIESHFDLVRLSEILENCPGIHLCLKTNRTLSLVAITVPSLRGYNSGCLVIIPYKIELSLVGEVDRSVRSNRGRRSADT